MMTWFTGKERDAETGLDYFGARYFSGAQGRFTSPDPTFMTRDRIGEPQQWNLYAYTRNNPLKYVDPDGRELKLAIYNSGVPTSAATRAADTIAAKFRQAGVKNVTYDLTSGSPSFWQTFRYQILPTPNSHLFEMRAGRAGDPAIRAGEGGHNWGGQSAVDTSVVTSKTRDEGQVATGVANMGTHEVAHDVLGHVDSPTNIMHSSGAADPNWLANPNLVSTPEQARALQQKYNKPGEVDRTPPRPPKKKEEKEEEEH
jgi:RHS repeat-associated protein